MKFPILLEIDNEGTVDLINNWSVGGRSWHFWTRQLFLCEMKEQGVFQVMWISGDVIEVDLSAKNLPGTLFEKHCVNFNGED